MVCCLVLMPSLLLLGCQLLNTTSCSWIVSKGLMARCQPKWSRRWSITLSVQRSA